MSPVDQLITAHQLRTAFPEEVLAEVAALEADPGIDDPALVDLTHLAFCTIDEPTSRDLDQALFLERSGDGAIAWYAIADAAHFVPLDSALFAEALRRGSSYYLPGRSVPMLPRALSEGLVSLNPQVDRRAVVWELHLDAQGACTRTVLHRARVRSRAKLSYQGVQAAFDREEPLPGVDSATWRSVALLPYVGTLRLNDADERDVVHYRRSELEVDLAADGSSTFVAYGRERNMVQRYNEQLSLLCNVEGARFLQRGDTDDDHVQPIYRVHEPPEPERLRRFRRQLVDIAEAHHLDRSWRWDHDEPLASFLDHLPTEGAEGRIAKAIHRQAVLLNQRSVFEAEPAPHHGVGAPVYGRFSAPMREVVGVFLHHELNEKLAGAPGPLPPSTTAEALREQVIEVSHDARDRQKTLDRAINRDALDHLFARSTGQSFTGTVMGVSRGRAHVQLDAPPIDVKVYTRHARGPAHPTSNPDGTAWLDEQGHPVLRIGDAVSVVVRGMDAETDRWDLGLDPRPDEEPAA